MILNAFLAQLKAKGLYSPEKPYLLAVSGGLDSMVLLHLFCQHHLPVTIAHCNFQLRGTASELDELLVRKTAEQLQIPLHCTTWDTRSEAQKQGGSIEMVARTLRYQFFENLVNTHQYAYVATAHHLNDQLETFLFNTAKGCGIAGIKGMQTQRGQLIRPLLDFSRKQLQDYADLHQIAYREDESNLEVKYQRNRIRHHIIPELKHINPELEKTFAATQYRISEAHKQLLQWAEELKVKAWKQQAQQIWMDKGIIAEQASPILLLEYWLRPMGFSFAVIEQIAQHLKSPAGKQFEGKNGRLFTDRHHLIYQEQQQDLRTIEVKIDDQSLVSQDFKLSFEKMAKNDYQLERVPDIGAFDLDKIEFPLKLRPWQLGDKFQPLGMRGKKKISDFLIDQKVPLPLKERCMVLESNGKIIWVVGYRPDDRFKITDSTTNIWRVQKQSL
ncbi:tRNA(Ile)-lysidine synthase [Persicobacter psychrovividus]|uniref:tRNA(Ile)-lysidine synthase n=2 Tax=Persicobacter psychrovividus TaxID=387638 RepID=A0ABM7VAB8_9BACT|nr:tRNA(Ile)-lysidine synthase [Persicobacter psychrovividus]